MEPSGQVFDFFIAIQCRYARLFFIAYLITIMRIIALKSMCTRTTINFSTLAPGFLSFPSVDMISSIICRRKLKNVFFFFTFIERKEEGLYAAILAAKVNHIVKNFTCNISLFLIINFLETNEKRNMDISDIC